MEETKRRRSNGNTCSLPHCKKSRRTHPTLKIFSCPPIDTFLGQMWRQRCAFPDEKNLFVCEEHFASEQIGRKYLKKEAIPSKNLSPLAAGSEYAEDVFVVNSPKKRIRSLSPEELVCSSCEKHVRNVIFYKKKYLALKTKFIQMRQKMKKINIDKRNALAKHKQISKRKSLQMPTPLHSLIEKTPYMNENSKTLCKMLITNKKKKEWSENEKTFAQNIFYRSQNAYKFLRNGMQLNLPHVTTLYRWAPVKNLQPGFVNSAADFLHEKCENMNERSKEAVLVLDEISIRRDLSYNSNTDIIDGLEDLGFQRSSAIGVKFVFLC